MVLFSEEAYELEMQELHVQRFIKEMRRVDREQGALLEKEGWTYKETAERRVMFTFGEVLLVRRCYTKNGKRRYPVDEYLDLLPYSRYSKGLLYKMASTAVDLTCRKAAAHFKELLHLDISKDAVHKARKMVTQLYKEREEYRFFEEEEFMNKKEIDILYIEGDGLIISTPEFMNDKKKTDFAHFLIHEGIEKEYGMRGKTVNKHEIWSSSNKKAREEVLDYLHNHYEIRKDTLLITNSDMGHGYTPYVFEEIAKAFSCKHEHFWDRYHLNKEISMMMKPFPDSFEKALFQAITDHNKREAREVLTQVEQLIPEEEVEFLEKFSKFSRKLLRNFSYTQTPEMRGLSPIVLGIMESNHTKMSYRMKKQGRYWSVEGALTMGRMIIDKMEGRLYDLFFGEWREKYAKYKSIEQLSVQQFLRKSYIPPEIRRVKQANKSGRRRYY
ncbi:MULTISPECIES: ISLre2 family transposase [Lactococcus]|uniref:ISLre2 family transposase n=1 Tax=Lactococcus muris TaxID=2941330 RepID=UPI00203FD680|nr:MULTISPECIES: ISLre2 family transposase [Lactococcus]